MTLITRYIIILISGVILQYDLVQSLSQTFFCELVSSKVMICRYFSKTAQVFDKSIVVRYKEQVIKMGDELLYY